MALINFIANFFGHGGVAYWIYHDSPVIDASGAEGFINDLLITAFFFNTLLCWLFIWIYKRKMEKGYFELEELVATRPGDWLPRNIWAASAVVGYMCLAITALPLGAYISIVGAETISLSSFSLSKALWAGLIASAIAPISIYHGVTIGAGQKPSPAC